MFKPNFVTRLATTGFILASTIFGAVEPAQARTCDTFTGGTVCYTLIERVGDLNQWNLTVLTNEGDEFIDVTCNGNEVYDWSSRGHFTQQEVDDFVTIFCAA